MGGKWPYSCCFAECCFQKLLITARRILEQLPSSFFSIRFVSVHVVHPYSSMDTVAAWEKMRFIFSDRSDLHMTDTSQCLHSLRINVKHKIYTHEYFFLVAMFFIFKKCIYKHNKIYLNKIVYFVFCFCFIIEKFRFSLGKNNPTKIR